MPSINPPFWKGVQTSSEQSTMNYISENLLQLERSTTRLQQSLANLLNPSPSFINNDVTDSDSQQLISNYLQPSSSINEGFESELFESQDLIQSVDAILKKNEELKNKVNEVLKENEIFKTEAQSYFSDNEEWNNNFFQESRKLETDLQEAIKNMQIQATITGTGNSKGLRVLRWRSRLMSLKNSVNREFFRKLLLTCRESCFKGLQFISTGTAKPETNNPDLYNDYPSLMIQF